MLASCSHSPCSQIIYAMLISFSTYFGTYELIAMMPLIRCSIDMILCMLGLHHRASRACFSVSRTSTSLCCTLGRGLYVGGVSMTRLTIQSQVVRQWMGAGGGMV